MAFMYFCIAATISVIMALSTLSYDCKGFRNSCDYMKDTITDNDPQFVCLQETWHVSSCASFLHELSEEYMLFETSGVDCSETILTGRPYGGLAIYFRRSLAGKIKRVTCMYRRICAITFNSPGLPPLLIVNVYMPCDTYSASTVNPA